MYFSFSKLDRKMIFCISYKGFRLFWGHFYYFCSFKMIDMFKIKVNCAELFCRVYMPRSIHCKTFKTVRYGSGSVPVIFWILLIFSTVHKSNSNTPNALVATFCFATYEPSLIYKISILQIAWIKTRLHVNLVMSPPIIKGEDMLCLW